MRKPTPKEEIYDWHRQALAGGNPVITHEPQAGFFRRRLVKGGPWVSARIWLHQEIDSETGDLSAPEELRCEVNGKPHDVDDQWTWLAGQPIPEHEYKFMLADADWAKTHAHQAPQANPREPVRSRNIPRLF